MMFSTQGGRIKIRRLARFTYGLPVASRYFQYCSYYFRSLVSCLTYKPDRILYFETISSLTPILLSRLPGRKPELFIHYHEYMNNEEYQKMFLNRSFHKMEMKIYSQARWISQTNADRMAMFLRDIGRAGLSNTHILPNYPPASWNKGSHEKSLGKPLRLVYVGSLGSMDLLYIREVVQWVGSRGGELSLDIYCFQVPEEIRRFIRDQHCDFVHLKGQVAYNKLPDILPQYDVGLILYKGGPDNTIYSVSNKMYEYLVCGLDVWYPKEVTGSHGLDSPELWPKVLRLDFSDLKQYNLAELSYHRPGFAREIDFSCEAASHDLVTLLIEKNSP